MRKIARRFALVTVACALLARIRRADRRRPRRPPRMKAPKLSGLDHRVGRGVVDRGVHQDGRRLPEAEQGHHGHLQLRLVGHLGDADPGWRARRRVRVGRRLEHAEGRDERSGDRRSRRLHRQPPHDRREAGQPEGRQVDRRPSEDRHDLAVRRKCPVREVRDPDAHSGWRDHPDRQDHPRPGRQGHTQRRGERRCRCGPRVRHRRTERREDRRPDQDPRIAQRARDLPDCTGRGFAEREAC